MRYVRLLPRIVIGGLVLFAISVMLYGVFMRYIVLPINDYFDLDPPDFFWVEEVGETALVWLTLIGAAVAVKERGHFALSLVEHRFSPPMRRALHVFHNLIIAGFGGLVAWVGFKLVLLDRMLTTPALQFSLGYVYAAAVVGGIMMVLYALDAARHPTAAEHSFVDVRE